MIILDDGTLFNFDPIIGYQIKHNITGRILPACQPYEVFTEESAQQRMIEVCNFYLRSNDITINPNEYHLEAVYYNKNQEYVLILENSKMF